MQQFWLTSLAVMALMNVAGADGVSPTKETQWHGYTRRHYVIDGCEAWIVTPQQALPGKPWVWCLEFPDAFVDRMGQ